MDTLFHDLRYALRTLLKSPGFTVVAVLTLALGIGANTAIFSVLNGVLLKPLAYHDPDRLVMVWEHDRISGTEREAASIPDYYDFRARSRSFAEMAAFEEREASMVGADGEPLRLSLGAMSHQVFPLLGVRPVVGRAFGEAEDRPGAPTTVVLGERLWRQRFGGAPDVVGRVVRLDGVPHTVIGVVPSGVSLPREDTDAWVPLQFGPTSTPRYRHNVNVVARLRPGATLESAQREMTALAAQLEAEHPNDNYGRGVTVEPLPEVVLGEVRPALLVLVGAVALVLLIACANVANLLLVRGTARVREVAVRTALGATAPRLARQFLTETLLLTGLGAAVGVLFAFWGLAALVGLAPGDVPRLEEVRIDGWVLALTLVVAVATGTLFGLVPTLQARRLDLQGTLREEGGTVSGGSAKARLRAGLVVAEVALSVLLVTGAGLLLRSFWKLREVDPGFRTENILRADFALPASRYPQSFDNYPRWSEVVSFQRELLERVQALPQVRSAALANQHPLSPGFTNSFVIEGREDEAAEQAEIPTRAVSPGYFETVGVPLLRGRALSGRDHVDAPAVVVINQEAARRYFPGENPVGKRISFWGTKREIVGVVGNERFHGLTEEMPPAAYPPLGQTPMGTATLLVRTTGDPEALAPAVAGIVRGIDPELALSDVETLEQTLARSIAQPRFTTVLLGTFASLALLLALVGVHGVLSYTVAQRTREIGVRIALGASRREVVRMVVGQGAAAVLPGLLLGLAASLAGARVLSRLLFGIAPTDPLTFLSVAGLVTAAALLASYLPALRAARMDPMVALRSE
ncbi:MAG TPA: ABC transporter permease [Longimicrobiaceae bacterium]|nr:ABC transporter permease [Longimicrobiaceae bacterium]